MRQLDPNAPIQRTGHGKLIEDANGDWWVYYLMGRPNRVIEVANGKAPKPGEIRVPGAYTTVGRETGLDPVRWLDDGWFVINEGKGPSNEQTAPDLPEVVYPKWQRDDFDSDTLDVHWQFVRRSAPGNYSLTERPGHMRIWTLDGQLFEIRAKNTLLRREEELSYTAVTKLSFDPTRDGEQAGLTCYYSTVTYARFSLCFEGGRKLQLVINRNHGEELIAEVDQIKNGPIWLKVEVDRLTRRFLYSCDGEDWSEAGVLKDCIYLCDEGVPDDPKRHTGTLVGIYANNGGCGSRIPADFDFFEFQGRDINI